MTPQEVQKYLEKEIEPKLGEMGTSYVILVENKQYFMVYNGYLDKIAYMLGQTLQEILASLENSPKEQEIVANAFEQGTLDEANEGGNKEDF